MAKIPQYQARESLDTAANTQPRGRVDNSIARAADNVGDILTRLGATLANQDEKLEAFNTEQRFSQLDEELKQGLVETSREQPAGAPTLAKDFTEKHLEPKLKKFIEETPARLVPKYEARTQTYRQAAINRAANHEYDTRGAYFKSSLDNLAGTLAADADNNPDGILASHAKLHEQIDNTTLPALEKETLKSKYGHQIAQAAINGLARAGRKDEARALAASIAGQLPEGPTAIDNTGVRGAARHAIIEEAKKQGFDPQTAVMVAQLESSLTHGRRNPESTAKGLFQLREKERREGGVPDDATIEQEAAAGIASLKKRAADLEAAGVKATPFTLYMAHFQGVGGAKAILSSDPSASLVETLNSVKAPGWRAKSGRTYGEEVVAVNKIPAGITTGEFVGSVNRRVNGGLVAASVAGLGWNERKSLVEKTESLIRHYDHERETNNRETARGVEKLIDSDVESIMHTGKEVGHPNLNESRVVELLGQTKADEWAQRREFARKLYTETKDFDLIPDYAIRARLDQLDPLETEGGKPGFEYAEKVFNLAQRKAEKIIRLRSTDPALAAAKDPDVKVAMANYDPENPTSVQTLVAARLEAQGKMGLPSEAHRPITYQEAVVLATGIKGGLPSETKMRMDGFITGLQQTYGPYAERVMLQVMGTIVKDQDLAGLAANAWKKLQRGEPITPTEGRKIDVLTDVKRGASFLSGAGAADVTRTMGPGDTFTDETGMTQSTPMKELPSFNPIVPWQTQKTKALILGEMEPGAFDAEFGAGASDAIMAMKRVKVDVREKPAKL